MVSGFFTSPLDQDLMISGDATVMDTRSIGPTSIPNASFNASTLMIIIF